MGIYTDIQTALDTQLDAGSFGVSIAYENVAFDPTLATSYIRPTTIYASGAAETLARLDSVPGIYQIDVFVETEKGPAALNTLLDSIQAHFKGTLILTAGSQNIYIRDISRLPGERDGSWYRGSLEVGFMAYDI